MRAPAHQARPDQHTNVQRTAECSGSSAGCLIVRKAPRGGLSMPSQASDRENRFPGGSIRAAIVGHLAGGRLIFVDATCGGFHFK